MAGLLKSSQTNDTSSKDLLKIKGTSIASDIDSGTSVSTPSLPKVFPSGSLTSQTTAGLLAGIGPAVTTALDKSSKEFDLPLGERAGLKVKQTGDVLKFIGQAGFTWLSGLGKTALEQADTKIFGLSKTAARERSSNPELEKILGGSETKSWQKIREDIDSYIGKQDIATDWEKKNLGITIAIAGFVADAYLGGAGKAFGKKVLQDIAKAQTEKELLEVAARHSIPKEIIEEAGERFIKAQTADEVSRVVVDTAEKITARKVAEGGVEKKVERPTYRSPEVQRFVEENPAVVEVIQKFNTADGFVKAVRNGDIDSKLRRRFVELTTDEALIKINSKYDVNLTRVDFNNAKEAIKKNPKLKEIFDDGKLSEDANKFAEESLTDLYKEVTSKPTQTGKQVGESASESPVVGRSQVEGQPTKSVVSESQTVPDDTLVPGNTLKEQYPIEPELSRFDNHIVTEAKFADNPAEYVRIGAKMRRAFEDVVIYVQNKEKLIKKLSERTDLKVDGEDVYSLVSRLPGIVGHLTEQGVKAGDKIIDDIYKGAKKSGVEVADFRADVNTYLHAKHAPERNLMNKKTAEKEGKEVLEAGSGMTDDMAKAELERIESLPYFKDIEAAAKDIKYMNERVLDMLVDSGVITKELFNTLKKTYKDHVPLNRVMGEEDDIIGALTMNPRDVKSTGIVRAKGSEREVNDIFVNVMTAYEQAIIRSQKNITNRGILKFVRLNEDLLKGEINIRRPRPLGEGFDGKRVIMETTNDPKVLQLFENGKPIWIEFKDPRLAMAFRANNVYSYGPILNFGFALTRLYSGLHTRFNIEFALSNKVRDLQESAVYLMSQKDIGAKGALGALTKDPGSIKAVTEAMAGLDTPGARLYNEMKEMGGTTGGMGLSTRKKIEIDINKAFNIRQNPGRKYANETLKRIDEWNTIFEDSTRLSAYKQALSQGATKERAAFLAKESTINFNRMGTGGPFINGMYMFANASLQGTTKMIKSLTDPKTAAIVVSTITGVVAMSNEWNDSIDPEWRQKVTKWDRLNGIPIVTKSLPNGDFEYFVIPVSWGLKPIKGTADLAFDLANGEDINQTKALGQIFTSIMDSYNPAGGSDFFSAAMPSIFFGDLMLDFARNQSWTGAKIKPDWDPYAPEDIKYFESLADTSTGKAAIATTEQLRRVGILMSPADLKYGVEQLIGGAGRFATKTMNALYGATTGDTPPMDEWPFFSRFLRQRTVEEVGVPQKLYFSEDEAREVLGDQSRERHDLTIRAERELNRINELSPDQFVQEFEKIKKTDPILGDRMESVMESYTKELSPLDKLVQDMGVKNFQRANFIFNKMEDLPADESVAMFEDLRNKKLITDEVSRQIGQLIQLKAEKLKPNK